MFNDKILIILWSKLFRFAYILLFDKIAEIGLEEQDNIWKNRDSAR